WVLLCLAAFAAGVVNALAGGGTLLTFPSLLYARLPDLVANTTSTVALVLGSLAGAWGYRRDLRGMGTWLWLLLVPSVLGGLVGALLLIYGTNEQFKVVIPWLLLLAATLFLCQPLFLRWFGHKDEAVPPALWLR